MPSPSPKLKKHVKGAVPPVNVAVSVTVLPWEVVAGDAVNEVRTRGGMEKVNVTGWKSATKRVPETWSSKVSPWVMVTFLIRPKWPGGGLLKTIVFWPWTTRLVMSKGPKLTNLFVNAVLSPVLTGQGGRLTTCCPLTVTFNWPTPLSQSSMSKPWKVNRTTLPVTVLVTVTEWVAVVDTPFVSVTVSMTLKVPGAA